MDKGIYCLVFKNPASTVRIGALGPVAFDAGWHCYIGSALGPGGLARLSRHCRLASERNKHPKWHVDYLLTDPRFVLAYTVSAPTTDRLECRLADSLGGTGVPGFGCSDCTCPTHLMYRNRNPQKEIVAAFKALDLVPTSKTIITPYVKGNI
jgi:Uri superfamily endonuclease